MFVMEYWLGETNREIVVFYARLWAGLFKT